MREWIGGNDSRSGYWEEYHPESADVLQYWEDHLSTTHIDPNSDYANAISDIVSEVGDNGIVQMHLPAKTSISSFPQISDFVTVGVFYCFRNFATGQQPF